MSLQDIAWLVVGGLVIGALGRLMGALLGSVVAASVLLVGYRRLVQGRPTTGPEARRPPRE